MADLMFLKSSLDSDNYESFFLEEDLFSLLDQSRSFDCNSFINTFMDFQTQTWFPSQDNFADPIYTNISTDHMFMASLELDDISSLSQDVLSGSWSEITSYCNNQVEQIRDKTSRTSSIEDSNNQIVLHGDNSIMKEKTSQKRKYRDQKEVVNTLTWEVIKQYFYMPIAKVAKELNIGLTLLKKRCRILGIPRWPHRKLMSLQALIDNLKIQLGNVEGEDNKSTVRSVLESLEMEKKRIEEVPTFEFGDRTKRLRQACFKAKYKRKRLMSSTSSV